MFLTIVSKNGERITKEWLNWKNALDDPNIKTVFDSAAQCKRFLDWAWESIPYTEAKARVEKLGYEVWEEDTSPLPEKVCRFAIWRRVDIKTRKPESVDFEGMKLAIKVT